MNPFYLYNTFSQEKVLFQPHTRGEVTLYLCGVTVYDLCHIGHARVFVVFDMIVRYLRAIGWRVKYIRNITDIDDKIIQRAQQVEEPISHLTARYIQAMQEDMEALNVSAPDKEPRATHHIEQMIQMIATLIEKGHAYVAEGDVYFDVRSDPQYGALAHKDLSQLQAGHRVEVARHKRSPLDFVLWKKAKPEEPFWKSPWGEGRPGWHIECSAMSIQLLGDTFDIHGGGQDLIFPHHENERAQSECATGKRPFVRYWMHVGFLKKNDEKMSKSLGNFLTVQEMLTRYDPEVIRYGLLASHYRSPMDSEASFQQAQHTIERLYTALRGLEGPLFESSILECQQALKEQSKAPSSAFKAFLTAMQADFNTPEALATLFEMAHALNHAKEKNPDWHSSSVAPLGASIKVLANTLGLLERTPEAYFQKTTVDTVWIDALIKEREEARLLKDWQRADEIRKTFQEKGIVLEDTPKGTLWKREG